MSQKSVSTLRLGLRHLLTLQHLVKLYKSAFFPEAYSIEANSSGVFLVKNTHTVMAECVLETASARWTLGHWNLILAAVMMEKITELWPLFSGHEIRERYEAKNKGLPK